LNVEELEYQAEIEASDQQWVPLRIVSPMLEGARRLPAIVILHFTGALQDIKGEICQMAAFP
jgi:hypothetical protein